MLKNVLNLAELVAVLILLSIATPAYAQQEPRQALGSGDAAVVPAPVAPPPTAAEVERLRGEVDELRTVVDRQARLLDELEQRLRAIGATDSTVASVAAPPTPVAPQSASGAARPAGDTVDTQVEELMRRWGKLRLVGDLQARFEGFVNQGFDAPVDVAARNRMRIRVRAQLAGDIGKNFDWGIRLASGSFDSPISPQQTFTDFYNRKPIGIDRAYVHFDSKTEAANLELWVGKFEAPWKRTPVTFDEDVQPEGLAESLGVNVSKDGALSSVEFVAWQLPYRERSVGADAILYGGQFLTEWKLSDAWSATLAGTFHDFEQVNVIPPATNVSPTLVNAGFDYGTTNTVVVNPFTNLPEYRSDYRVIDAIAELRYASLTKDGRWPLVLRADWIHNTSAFNNQKDGGQAEVIAGRRQEQGDWSFDYIFWKVEREAFPSVFMDSEMVIQTNSVSHAVRARYMLRRQVEFAWRYLAHRRLQTTSPENRWLNHLQFDVQYRF
jgi:hypothetical protein